MGAALTFPELPRILLTFSPRSRNSFATNTTWVSFHPSTTGNSTVSRCESRTPPPVPRLPQPIALTIGRPTSLRRRPSSRQTFLPVFSVRVEIPSLYFLSLGSLWFENPEEMLIELFQRLRHLT